MPTGILTGTKWLLQLSWALAPFMKHVRAYVPMRQCLWHTALGEQRALCFG